MRLALILFAVVLSTLSARAERSFEILQPNGIWQQPREFQQPRGVWQQPGEFQQPNGRWQMPGEIQTPRGLEAPRTTTQPTIKGPERRRTVIGNAPFDWDKPDLRPDGGRNASRGGAGDY